MHSGAFGEVWECIQYRLVYKRTVRIVAMRCYITNNVQHNARNGKAASSFRMGNNGMTKNDEKNLQNPADSTNKYTAEKPPSIDQLEQALRRENQVGDLSQHFA